MSSSENFLIAEAQLVLDQARKEKAERIKSLGEPIELPGKALAIEIYEDAAWIAENTTVVRKLDLESGKTLRLFRGHTGPVTSLAFYAKVSNLGKQDILITGSWDKSIRLWDTRTSEAISVTPNAHSDFVKALLVFPSLQLLVSGSSDNIVRFWDLSHSESLEPLQSLGSISSHTRPVECLDGQAISDDTAVLYTGDTMGVIKVWNLKKGTGNGWTATLRDTINHHRTRINDLKYGNEQLWTASADETIRVIPITSVDNAELTKLPNPIKHPVAVRAILPLLLTDLSEPYLISAAGDVLRTFDVSSLQEPELLSEIDSHWHDITSIRLWMRRSEGVDDRKRIEPWILTTSLDKTIRKWKLADLLSPPPAFKAQKKAPEAPASALGVTLTEEEERELEELMGEE